MLFKRFPKHTLVQYKGGGYDGCIYEWNWAYFDKDRNFHDVASSGYAGCDTVEKLQQLKRDDVYVYHLNLAADRKELGKECAPDHLYGLAKWFQKNHISMDIPVVCADCGDTFNICDEDQFGGLEGLHGCGGLACAHSDIICYDCYSLGSCAYCGEYVGQDHIVGESGYCEWCEEEQNPKVDEEEDPLAPPEHLVSGVGQKYLFGE